MMARRFVRTNEHVFPLKPGVDAPREELVAHILEHHAKGGYPYHVVELDELYDQLEPELLRRPFGAAGVIAHLRSEPIHLSGPAVFESARNGNPAPVKAELVQWLLSHGWVEAPAAA